MQNLLTVATQVGILFVLMGIGAACRWTSLVTESGHRGLVNLLILIVTPCLIVDVFQRPYDAAELGSLGTAFLIAFLGHLAIITAATLLIRHRSDATRRVLMLSAVFSNAGFMGIPLEQSILGDRGVFFGITYVVVFNFTIWSWGLMVMKGGASFSRTLLVNPGTVGLAIALPLFFLSIRLPPVFAEPIHLMAGLNTPLAMIVIGYSLASARLGSVFRDGMAYVTMGIRLIAYPLAVIVCLLPFRASFDRTMVLALVIGSSAPVAAMVSMLAAKYERDVDMAVGVITASTLLSIITIPCVVALALEVF